MSTPEEHRQLRELLGAHAFGALPDDSAIRLRAHLDGCADCRAELAEIAPVAESLRDADVDVATLATFPAPPAELGESIRRQIGHERALSDARARRQRRREQTRQRARWLAAAAAAVALLTGAVGTGTVIGRATAPDLAAVPAPAPIPVEQVPVLTTAGVRTGGAEVIAHSWGVEARFEGTGFTAGQVYRAAFRSTDGRLQPAGEFLGTGATTLKCNMQSALLRSDTADFVVTDRDGRTVLSAQLSS